MRSQVVLLVSLCTCCLELEAVSLSKKDVPSFMNQAGGGGNDIRDLASPGMLTGANIPGAIDGKKWAHSKSDGLEKASSTWSGNNWVKRNIWDAKHLNQREEASAVSNQGGKVQAGAGGAKENKKAAYTASRQYSKTRNEGTSQATLTGKSASFVNRFGGRNWGDVASSSNNVGKAAVGSGSGEADVKSEDDLTSSYAKRGREQTFQREGKSVGDGQVQRSYTRDFDNLAAAAKSESGTTGLNIGGAGGDLLDRFNTDKTNAHGDLGTVAGNVEVGTASDNGQRLVLQDDAGIEAGRNLLPMAGVADNAAWTAQNEINRPNKMSHGDWLKYTYHQGDDCVPGQMEGTNGCRWRCGSITGAGTPNYASGATNLCTTHSLTCHLTNPTADVADGVLGTTDNNQPCSTGCTGAGPACANPFA